MDKCEFDAMDDGFVSTHDLDWYAFDHEWRLHHFATAGRGVVPEAVRASMQRWRASCELVDQLPCRFEVEVVTGKGSHDSSLRDFVEMASKGLYSHDVSDGDYRLIARPKHPRVILPLDEQADKWIPRGRIQYADDGVTVSAGLIAELEIE
ncbi:hypothetical protein [Stenotrophomonas sp.]|uniref:hypothetical protein n=1 Tax=Stenotrophomonas sp. TaxID=69392 RepID=UPI00289FAC03|nr:hypothetical protein [Stenotrophomonas sp.]